MTSSLEVLREIASSVDSEKFTAVVGNPPYQQSSSSESNNNAATNVFQHFYDAASSISLQLSLVFPGGRWMQRSAGSGEIADLIYKTVAKVDWYRNGDEKEGRELFADARIRDGVSIVYSNLTKVEPTIIWNGNTIPRPGKEDIYPLQKELTSIALKGILFCPKRANGKYVTRTFFGVYSQWTEKNPEKCISISESPIGIFPKPIKAWLANEIPGSGKSVKEYWIDESSVVWTPQRRKMFTSWKVIAGQGGVGKDPEYENYRVIDNEHIVGESYVIVGSFTTEIEAVNYSLYLDSDVIRKMLAASKGGKLRKWGWFVPDLEDYTSNNPLFKSDDELGPEHEYYGLTLDQRLYRFFNLTDEEIAIVEDRTTSSEKDRLES